MNKKQLVNEVSNAFGTTYKDADKILTTFISIIERSLLSWQEINIHWFGKFYLSKRKERESLNPRTWERIKVASFTTPAFKAWKVLKDIIKDKFDK